MSDHMRRTSQAEELYRVVRKTEIFRNSYGADATLHSTYTRITLSHGFLLYGMSRGSLQRNDAYYAVEMDRCLYRSMFQNYSDFRDVTPFPQAIHRAVVVLFEADEAAEQRDTWREHHHHLRDPSRVFWDVMHSFPWLLFCNSGSTLEMIEKTCQFKCGTVIRTRMYHWDRDRRSWTGFKVDLNLS